MKTLLAAFLLCLAGLPALSQRAPVRALRPRFVQVDTLAYDAAGRYMRTADSLLQVRAARIVGLEQKVGLLTQEVANRNAEVERGRLRNEAQERDNTELAARLDKVLALPLQKPLLLDPHFYEGTAVGGGVLLLLKIFLLPKLTN